MRLAFSQLTASSYARPVFRQYSVENGRLDSTSGTAPKTNIMPQAESSLYSILKEKYKGRKGLSALEESGLTWGDVDSIKASVDSRVQFKLDMEKRLTQAGINSLEAGLFADFLTVIAFSSQMVIQCSTVTDFLSNLLTILDPPTSSSLRANPLSILKPAVSCGLFSRVEEMSKAINHINSYVKRPPAPSAHGIPCFIFTGSSGCGKTRMLFQIAMMSLIHNDQEEEVRKFLKLVGITEPAINSIITVSKSHVALLHEDLDPLLNVAPFKVVAVSFNGVMDIDDLYEADLMKNNLEAAVCLRLIYSTRYDHLEWKTFLETISTRFDMSRLSRVLRFPELSRAMFPWDDSSPLVLILFDELLMPTYEHGTSTAQITSLMSTIHQAIDRHDSNVYGIIWSAMFDASIIKERTSTRRKFDTCFLGLLDTESMKSIMKSNYENGGQFHNAVEKLRERYPTTMDDVIGNLSAMCGGLPRSIDFMVEACKKLQRHDYAEIFEKTARIHGERYRPQLDIIMMALSKYEVPQDYPIGSSTALEAADRGFFLVVKRYIRRKTIVPQVPELSLAACGFMEPDDEFSQGMIECFYELFQMRVSKPNNVFEEVLRRREILLRHLRNEEEYDSIHPFQLFHPYYACSNHNPDLRVVGNIKLSSSVKRFKRNRPPSPNHRDAENYLWSPKSHLESGIDWLLILPKYGDDMNRVAVGVQCKVRKDTVGLEELEEANQHFIDKMAAVGWNREDLFLVFIIDGKTSTSMNKPRISLNTLMSTRWKNIAIVSNGDDRLKKMLGTTVHSFNMSLKETAQRPGRQEDAQEKGQDQPSK